MIVGTGALKQKLYPRDKMSTIVFVGRFENQEIGIGNRKPEPEPEPEREQE